LFGSDPARAPGMMPIDNIQVQLIDTPPINREFVEPEFYVMLRRADMILLIVDLEADVVQALALPFIQKRPVRQRNSYKFLVVES